MPSVPSSPSPPTGSAPFPRKPPDSPPGTVHKNDILSKPPYRGKGDDHILLPPQQPQQPQASRHHKGTDLPLCPVDLHISHIAVPAAVLHVDDLFIPQLCPSVFHTVSLPIITLIHFYDGKFDSITEGPPLKGKLLAITALLALLLSSTAITQAVAHLSLPFSHAAVCSPLSPLVREERLPAGAFHSLPPLMDGDILLTFCVHSFGWRHGHAALVIDGENKKTLEALTCFSPSVVLSAESWRSYPSFVVLRLGENNGTAAAAASYAEKHLVGVDYRLTSGLLGKKAPDSIHGGQCAYLIWYAFQALGVDLDSDGGKLVTVADLRKSPLLDVVAEIGM